MRRLALTTAAAVLVLLVLPPPAWAEWVWPVRGEVITPYRNGSDPYAGGQHRGIDIAGPVGAPVVAAAAGLVRFVGVAGSSGLTVGIRTADGGFDTSYLHLSAASVREGERVAVGAPLGAVGTSGRPSVARPHLHFGVRDAGTRHGYRDPLALLPPPSPPGPQPDPPPAVPAPSPAPAGRVPAPAPQQAPAPARRHAPVRVPLPAPRRVPAPSRRAEPLRTPAAAPGAAAAAAASSAPGPRHAGDAAGVGEQAGASAAGARHGLGAAPAPLDAPRAPAPRQAEPAPRTHGGGVDLGLVLASVALLMAAAILFFTGRGRGVERNRLGLAARLRPLAGR